MEAFVNKYVCNLDEQPLNAFEQEQEAQISKNHRKMEEPGKAVEGFDDIDEIDSDLEDEPVPLAIEVLVLSCI